jgi:maltose-6'-phosphate glucosidase
MMPKLREYIMEHEILLPEAYPKDKAALAGKKKNRHTIQ